MLAFLFTLALAPSLVLSPSVRVARAADGAGIDNHIESVVQAPSWAVEAVILDTGGYPKWFPSSQSVRVLEAQPNVVLFEGRFRLPWPVGEVGERLRLRRQVVAADVVVEWEQERGDFRRNQGRWTLSRIDGQRTKVSYDAVLQTRHWVPRWMLRIASRKQAPRMMRALEARAQQRACTVSQLK